MLFENLVGVSGADHAVVVCKAVAEPLSVKSIIELSEPHEPSL